MKKILKTIISAAGFAAIIVLSPASYAGGPVDQINIGADKTGTGGGPSVQDTVSNLLSGVFVLVGIISVCMIVYGGIKYTTSAGDTSKAIAAKNTITYAIVGLIVSMSAYAIVNFIVIRL